MKAQDLKKKSLRRKRKEKLISVLKDVLMFVTPLLIILVIFGNDAFGQTGKDYIPPRAYEYRDSLYKEISRTMPEIPDYNYVPALIEHESCISLKHSRCWSSTSELKNSREHSIGFFQIARAFNPDGSTRMDTLQTLKNRYKSELGTVNWGNLASKPDKQIFAGVNLINDNWKIFYDVKDPWERLAFTDNAYNGGSGWVQRERRECGLKKGCDPNVWYGNVEYTCQRSKKPIPAYGNRSICDISRNHTKDVIHERLPKYKRWYFNEDYQKGK